ncbi:peptidoglycan -binding protein [Rhodopila sp.]|uniref:peptidoglycan -binding protein n=1 Tax=Rhodopila sp. TaxID=2480087 RepID=UPI003D09FAAE
MASRIRRHGGNGLDAWPGYVDALSTLLMVIIFVLLVFVLAQAFLSVTLSGRSQALDKATKQLAELSDALSLERGRTASLQLSVSQLGADLAGTTAERDRVTRQLNDANAAIQTAAAASSRLQAQLTDTTRTADAATRDAEAAKAHLAEMRAQIAALDRTVATDKDTLQAKLSDLATLAEQSRALAALRDDLEKQAQDAAARAMTEQQRRQAVEVQLGDERKLGDSARAQIALLNQQIDQLKNQLSAVASSLDLAQQQGHEKDVQITNLGQKLNLALAAKVKELQQYRSEFFGKLRGVLANRPGIQVVGDRFVFQSEVLFPVGSADMTPAGAAEMTALAITIKDVAAEIPPDLHWILRVDGHTDPQPVKGGAFASNWELSAARAITVVKLLIADGVPPDHLAATAFGEYQPLGTGDTPDAYAKDRRIELRLTDR